MLLVPTILVYVLLEILAPRGLPEGKNTSTSGYSKTAIEFRIMCVTQSQWIPYVERATVKERTHYP